MDNFDISRIDELAGLYRISRQGPFWKYPGITEEQLVSSFAKDVCAGVKSGKMLVLTAENKGRLTGFVILEKKEWDSGYFGLSMAEIVYLVLSGSGPERRETGDLLLDKTLQCCKMLGIQHIATKIDIKDDLPLDLLKNKGFSPLSEEHIHILDKRNFKSYQATDETGFHLRAPRPEDMRQIISCAAEMSETLPSRFLLDKGLPEGKRRKYYTECVERYCRLEYADEALIGERKGEVVAFHAHRFFEMGSGAERVKGVYVLMAFVSRGERGRNTGNIFLSSVYRRLLGNNDFITGRVLGVNKAMLHLLEKKLGAGLLTVQQGLHKPLS